MATYGNGFARRKKLFINGLSIANNITSFPLPLNITNSSQLDFSNVVSDSGNDVHFYDSNDNQIPFERTYWEDGNNNTEFHIRTDITAGSTSQFIYMYYDKSGAVDLSNGPSVFPDNEYNLVIHGNEKNSVEFLDSSGLGSSLVRSGSSVIEIDGKLGKAIAFPGDAGNFIDSGNSLIGQLANFSIEWLAKSSDYGSGRRRVFSHQTSGYIIGGYNANELELGSSKDTVLRTKGADTSDNNWNHYVVQRAAGSSVGWFFGISLLASQSITNGATYNENIGVRIGAYNLSDQEHFAGNMDELRLHKRSLTTDWITISNKAMVDQDVITYGAEETPSAEPAGRRVFVVH